jgi:hypothetical protein
VNKLIQRVNDINELDKTLNEHEMKMNLRERCLDYFKQASSPNHSLFSLLERFKSRKYFFFENESFI